MRIPSKLRHNAKTLGERLHFGGKQKRVKSKPVSNANRRGFVGRET
jgi:hypothetical protein